MIAPSSLATLVRYTRGPADPTPREHACSQVDVDAEHRNPEPQLKPGGRIAGFHLVGAQGEGVLKQLAAGARLTLEVQPAEGAAFTIPLPTTDFAWAHQEFASCLRSS